MNPPEPTGRERGYTLLIVMFAIFLLTLGLMLAMPVWQTQIQRELEEELIFRGRQYVEAVRLFQIKNPGTFPASFDGRVGVAADHTAPVVNVHRRQCRRVGKKRV